MRAFLQAVWTRVSHPSNFAIWILSSVAAAYMGPFGTYFSMGMTERMIIWVVVVGWGLFLIALAMSAEDVFFPELTFKQQEALRLTLMPPVIMITMYPPLTLYFAPTPVPLTFLQSILAVYMLGAIVTGARFAVHHANFADDLSEAEPDGPRLLRRLPDGAAGPILRLSGKDHFVEIITPTERYQVRMRLADAVAEMDGVEGYFTHRSHWVTRDAIKSIKRSGAKHYIVSTDAELIPVTRSNLPKLEEAGVV